MTIRRDDMAWITGSHWQILVICVILPFQLARGFGNEYVHIKVHVPKGESSAEESAHKVIHHYHHHPHPHQLLRNRGRARPKPSHLLESVILSDLDKPLHQSEHTDYLIHAKELANHLAESYAKKAPPAPPKKKVNTYTVIEEQHSRPHGGYDYLDHQEPSVETYRVIESRPKYHHPAKKEPEEEEDEDDYSYQHHHRSLGIGNYAEPAPVEEHVDQEPDLGYVYPPPPPPPPSHAYIPPSHSHSHGQAHRNSKSNRAPAYTLEAPQESSYGYDYSSGSSSDFRPSVQVPFSDPAEEEVEEPMDTYGPPIRHHRPSHSHSHSHSLVDWPESKGFNSAAAETYSGVDSYNVGHVQGYPSGGYQYSGPYL
ncbi:uncharacterized protein LOC108137410 [Drosophila elegans]|uniref:uncharacterized protein LOC108137410 n=1 Tax=Drosophila elegans TaxID=30023 RepID=UPI0007E8818F|nr:uncharacterized protein LOC108137410 [Drosophila elegans]